MHERNLTIGGRVPGVPRCAAMYIRSLENRAFLLLVLAVSIAFAWTIGGFLMPVFWAAVLAVLFTPTFRRISRRLRGRASAAALLTLLGVLLVVVVPVVLIGVAVTGEAVGVYGDVAAGRIDLTEPVAAAERLLPRLTGLATEFGVDLDRVREGISTAALTASRTLASQLLAIGQQTVHFALMLAVTLYVLFFFLRDGDRLVEALVRALPLGDPRERQLLARFAAITRATVKGTFIVAAVQGTIGGLAFWALGLGAPLLWGVIMGLLSLLPAVGSALVWVPAAVYLLAVGAWGKAIILVGVGAGGIGMIDNALRPILVGREAGMPDYLILLSTLGGIATFGLSGVVVGPVIAGLFLSTWGIFADEFGPLDADAPVAQVTEPGPRGDRSQFTEPEPPHVAEARDPDVEPLAEA